MLQQSLVITSSISEYYHIGYDYGGYINRLDILIYHLIPRVS